MPGIFLDTSAFAKLYIAESGSEELGNLIRKTESLVVSVIILPETLSALRRLVREGSLEEKDYQELKERICGDIATIEVVSVSDEVIKKTIAAMELSQLRTLDALHIGSAIAAGTSLFVTADERQAKAARSSGLAVRLIS
jgi:predicted nucleic acid-binding protein